MVMSLDEEELRLTRMDHAGVAALGSSGVDSFEDGAKMPASTAAALACGMSEAGTMVGSLMLSGELITIGFTLLIVA